MIDSEQLEMLWKLEEDLKREQLLEKNLNEKLEKNRREAESKKSNLDILN